MSEKLAIHGGPKAKTTLISILAKDEKLAIDQGTWFGAKYILCFGR